MEAQVEVTVGSQSKVVDAALAMATADEMGAGPENLPTFNKLAPPAPVVFKDDGKTSGGQDVSVEGAARSTEDRIGAEAAGYETKGTVYVRGSKVVDIGVENAKEARAEWEAMPATVDGCDAIVRTVKAEDRKDLGYPTAEIRMSDTGELLIGRHGAHHVTGRAMRGIVGRIGCGGAKYLLEACSPELRAYNVNAQAKALAGKDDSETVLRTRTARGGKECFAAVSPSYAKFDADQIATIVKGAVLPECRGKASYDGQRTRIEALIHTTVQPENFVAGEFFRAGIVCDSDDTGAGGIRVRGVVFQNLCLNLMILDEAWQDFGYVMHLGDSRKMHDRIARSLQSAVASLEHFRKAWGYAATTMAVTEEQLALGREIAAMSLFRGILQRDLVKVSGKVEENAKLLTQLYFNDRSSATATVPLSKAAVVNAFTALAHEKDGIDVWEADDISAQATRLLLRKQPLPFELIEA